MPKHFEPVGPFYIIVTNSQFTQMIIMGRTHLKKKRFYSIEFSNV